MGIKIIRIVFVLACVTLGVAWAGQVVGQINELRAEDAAESLPEGADEEQLAQLQNHLIHPLPWEILGGLTGLACAGLVLAGLRYITQDIFEKLSPALGATVLGMLIGYAVAQYVKQFWHTSPDSALPLFVTTTLVLLFGFMGISLGLTRASHWESLVQAVHRGQADQANPKLVDTSVVIDGRIADICQTGFLDGTLLIPRFVLKELQNIADSPDALRRARGRRGLDILKRMQEDSTKAKVQVIDDDPPDVPDVDAKLMVVARDYDARIITNDFNLNKVAQIEGIDVLNINDLANALKPAVLPDEALAVKIIKEGKEPLQGVGYLDDGTMVVVDGGQQHIGKEASVIVTSVLQTAAGRMIFGKLLSVSS